MVLPVVFIRKITLMAGEGCYTLQMTNSVPELIISFCFLNILEINRRHIQIEFTEVCLMIFMEM
jgi:hypothetical protein